MNAPQPTAPRFFQPLTLLAGLVLGLGLMAWAGRAVAHRDWHKNFQRFHPWIAPESQYQPTIAEMCAIVRARCRADQILVVIGGNSVFQGVGQPVEKLWTRRLQELLGDRYAVVNLAFRGSSATDGGAIVAEVLRQEFPRQIYLANTLPFTGASPAGSRDYRFMMYDAYAKGWLVPYSTRTAMLRDHSDASGRHEPSVEFSLGAWLDAGLRFNEFWNWWSSVRGFTFPTPRTPHLLAAFRARNNFEDQETDFETIPFKERFAERYQAAEMSITRATSAKFYELDATGQWTKVALAFGSARESKDAFPPVLRSRSLLVLSANSPFYVRQLSAAEQARNTLAYADSLAMWHELGHPATDYGPGFEDADFGDRTHLTAQGGRKLAEHLAPEIRVLAGKLGYPNP